jgi:transglutaminase-like putative cysteine protease
MEVSDLGNWSDVVRGVAPLFAVKERMSPELATVVSDIRGAGGTPAEQALRALQFVQDEIRYVSISIGRGAYQPASPGKVLSRRYGDCKDKSLLLATICGNSDSKHSLRS